MADRHIKQWNIEEPPVPVFEDGCGCVSEVTRCAISKSASKKDQVAVAGSAQEPRRP
jgi:hypothetical protein